MNTYKLSSMITRVVLILAALCAVQMLLTVRLTEQSEIDSQGLKENSDSTVGKLELTPRMLLFLIKKYSQNPKLREYLKVLKKKKFDETYADEDDDYNYQSRFRF